MCIRIRHAKAASWVCCGAAGFLIAQACGRPQARVQAHDSSDSARAAQAGEARTSPLSTAGPAASSQSDSALLAWFQVFLDSSVVTRRDSSAEYPGPADWCEDDQVVPPVDYLLAYGRSLAINRRTSDLATVRAELTIVGEDSLSDAGVRRVQLGVRTDTVNWNMIADSLGRWHLCGYASTERGLGRMGTRQYPAEWVPAGAGWDDVARLADSVRGSRGLPR